MQAGVNMALGEDQASEPDDLGPLAWVLDELRSSLETAIRSLRRYARDADDARSKGLATVDVSQLRIARQHLHQAVGVLEMVELAAPAQVLRAMEAAAAKCVEQPVLCDAQAAAKLERCSFALLEYLQARISGRSVSAVALFSQYLEVQQLAGAQRAHPADLWSYRLRWLDPRTPPAAQTLSYGAGVKSQLDTAVLKIIRSTDPEAGKTLSDLCAGLAASQQALRPRVFWKVASALFEALQFGLLPLDVYVKRAASGLLQSYVALSKGDPEASERLLLDLLFFCAQAAAADAGRATRLAAVRGDFELERFGRVDYDRVQFGLFDPAQLTLARKRVASVREIWSALSGGDVTKLGGLAEQFSALGDALVKLHPLSAPLAQGLSQVVETTVRSGRPPPAELAMEVATSVLYLEAAFEDLDPSDVKLAQRTTRLAERLLRVRAGEPAPALESWMEELYRRVSDRQTMGSVVGEMRTSLSELEQSLDKYFRNPSEPSVLRNVPGQLGQMKGVLSLLGMDQAVRALSRMRETVEQLSAAPALAGGDQLDQRFDMLAGNLGALGFMLDMLSYQPALAKKLFVFDETLGELKPVMGRADRGHADVAEVAPTEPTGPSAPAVAELEFELDLGPDLVADAALPVSVAAESSAAEPEAKPETLPEPEMEAEGATAEEAEGATAEEVAVGTATESGPASDAALAPVVASVATQTDSGDDELLGIFVEEAREVVSEGLALLGSAARAPVERNEHAILRRAFHTLKGSSRMVGLEDFGEAGWAMEQLLVAWLEEPRPASADLDRLCRSALTAFGEWTEAVAARTEPGWSSSLFRPAADALRVEGRYLPLSAPAVTAPQDPTARERPVERPQAGPDPIEFQSTQTPQEHFDVEVGEPGDAGALQRPASLTADQLAPMPEASLIDDQYKEIGSLRIGLALYSVYLNEADEWSRRLLTECSEWALELHREPSDSSVAWAHSLAGSSATVGFEALARLARKLEHALLRVQHLGRGNEEQGQCFQDAAQEISRLLHQFAAGFLKEPDPAILSRLQSILDDQPAPPALATAAAPRLAHEAPIEAEDRVDADVFPIFEEEAVELLPQLSAALRRWVAQPRDQESRNLVLRGLHTLKGSARLAGAMRLGEMAHRMESVIEAFGGAAPTAARLEPLLASLDAMESDYEQLASKMAQPAGQRAAEASAPVGSPPAMAPEGSTDGACATPEALLPAGDALAKPAGIVMPMTRPAAKQVRVRSQLLDHLVGVAGEAMGTGARLEVNLGHLRDSLEDLTGNLERLRQQLRDVELHAELQMQTRLSLTRDSTQGFDPLEFDRFTRVQELTRMMAESVNDVATIQRNLQRTIVSTEDDLHAQSRQTRELQRDLLRTRMVEFDGVSERLHRVVRQSAAETQKQVRLNISGGAIEIDRGVLDRMIPAFEHLLRNCVVHGIEDATLRMDNGKDPTGVVAVSLKLEGNDVSIEIQDDGAGLNLTRIREKALALGWLSAEQEMSDADAANLILMPGFSTAAEVTELAGRGVGMDVVRAEVNAIGGRIETSSRTGQGTCFKLVLPLTTAVTKIVMLRAGALTLGVPASMVELVHRATADEIALGRQSGLLALDERQIPFFWAGALLQSSATSLESEGDSFPVMVLLSTAQRVALQVDEVLGHQEVVVKNLGPQLSRLPGLTGVSALPTGATVLIYNPVALAAVYGAQARQYVAEAEAAAHRSEADRSPGSSQEQAPLVLVVDDSITVRRVTQRLLQREGYRVALANDGLQALERLREERPLVMLSDIEMPRMDGFELLIQVRQQAEWADLPVVMISSRSAEKHREHARQLGVDHYLGKPYGEDELLQLIRSLQRAQGPH